MPEIKSSMRNVPEISDIEGAVPVVMADAKKVSDKRAEETEEILAKHREETGTSVDKAFTGTKGETMEGKNNPELKKLDLNESLFEAYNVREYTNKLLDLVDAGAIDKDFLIIALIKYMSEDEVEEFCRMNDIFDDDEDVDEGLLDGNTINLNVDATGQSAAFLNGRSGDVVNEVLNDNTINLNVDASGSSVGFLGGTAGQVTNEAATVLERPKIDLSKKQGSMTQVLSDASNSLNSCASVDELHNKVKELFDENGINTVASNRLLTSIAKSRNLTDAQQTVYNSILSGSGLGTIKSDRRLLADNESEIADMKDNAERKPIIDDDGNEYDMFNFVYDMLTKRTALHRKPVSPTKFRAFNYNGMKLGDESSDVETNTAIHADRDGDVVVEAKDEARFEPIKAMCDAYQLDYEIIPPRAQSTNTYKYSMKIWIPFDYEGNPQTVEDYFNEIGIDPRTVVTGQDKKKYKTAG